MAMQVVEEGGNGKGILRNPVPHIGAFVLETLTLGMYGEPRHTLREYVQNAFDSIGAAQRLKFLAEAGCVNIVVEEDAIVILDNGLGVSADQAWKTLTSIGASKKERERDAGFRGIGRLAGMAYCDELTFRTTFPGETIVSSIKFDCEMLLTAMSPDKGGEFELSRLLHDALTFNQVEAIDLVEEHFFEVTLRGLTSAPVSLTSPEDIRSYLSQTVPVKLDPSWARTKEIENTYQQYFGKPLETVQVWITHDGNRTEIVKPYGESYEHANGIMKLQEVDYYSGEDGWYWAWVGRLNESAAVTDKNKRGLRVRVRNIQINGTDIVEKLFADLKPSYGRFNNYYVGEIHVNPKVVVPNARRDGFEELEDWENIRESLSVNVCKVLASDAYEASKRGGQDIDAAVEDVRKVVARADAMGRTSRFNYDQVVDLLSAAKRHRRKIARLRKIVSDLDEGAVEEGEGINQKTTILQEAADDIGGAEEKARLLMGQTLGEQELVEGLKSRLREQLIRDVLDVVNAFVDSSSYQKIKDRLYRRFGVRD